MQKIGWPEGRIILAETTIYLAASQKSNSAYLAIDKALDFVKSSGNLPVPLSLRNAPTRLMKELGYGENYRYSHDYKNHFAKQDFLPNEAESMKFWEIQGSPQEKKMGEWLNFLWEDRYKV